jgi:hypothetical protein
VGWGGVGCTPSTQRCGPLIDSARVENKKLSSGTTGREWYIYHARGVSGPSKQPAFVKRKGVCAHRQGPVGAAHPVHKRKHFISVFSK